MLDAFIKGWHTLNNKSRLKLIESLLGDENFFRFEFCFYDEGRVTTGITRLKEDYEKISAEIDFVQQTSADSEETAERLNFLYKRQLEILEAIAFQSSQRLEKVPACLNLLKGLKRDFSVCLEGLSEYQKGNVEVARQHFEKYLAKYGDFRAHYQLNKIYGRIELNAKDYVTAKIFLQRVIQICPEDAEVHQWLLEIYSCLNDSKAAKIHHDIAKLLEEKA